MNFDKIFKAEKPKKQEDWLEKIRKYYKGDFHSHSLNGNRLEIDGAKEEMVHSDTRLMQYADKLGLDFIFFSEHSSNPGAPKKLEINHPICQSLLKQKEKVDNLNNSQKYKTKAYSAVEANIFFDNGEAIIDVPNEILAQLDLVVASRHKIADKLDPRKIKESLLAAINNKDVDIIGHPYRYIEFYENDWNYFKKYYTQDEEISTNLNYLEKNGDWDSIKQIIGKKDLTNNSVEKYKILFDNLKKDYWQTWNEVLDAMAKNKKCFELNLSSFNPDKEFYQTLLKKASSYPELLFSITYDFHNLGQLDNYDNKNYTNNPPDIKNPARRKGTQRLLQLIDLLQKNNIEPERIVNSSNDNLNKFINSHNK